MSGSSPSAESASPDAHDALQGVSVGMTPCGPGDIATGAGLPPLGNFGLGIGGRTRDLTTNY